MQVSLYFILNNKKTRNCPFQIKGDKKTPHNNKKTLFHYTVLLLLLVLLLNAHFSLLFGFVSTDVRIKLEALKGCPKGFLNVCLTSLCIPCIKQPNVLHQQDLQSDYIQNQGTSTQTRTKTIKTNGWLDLKGFLVVQMNYYFDLQNNSWKDINISDLSTKKKH